GSQLIIARRPEGPPSRLSTQTLTAALEEGAIIETQRARCQPQIQFPTPTNAKCRVTRSIRALKWLYGAAPRPGHDVTVSRNQYASVRRQPYQRGLQLPAPQPRHCG